MEKLDRTLTALNTLAAATTSYKAALLEDDALSTEVKDALLLDVAAIARRVVDAVVAITK